MFWAWILFSLWGWGWGWALLLKFSWSLLNTVAEIAGWGIEELLISVWVWGWGWGWGYSWGWDLLSKCSWILLNTVAGIAGWVMEELLFWPCGWVWGWGLSLLSNCYWSLLITAVEIAGWGMEELLFSLWGLGWGCVWGWGLLSKCSWSLLTTDADIAWWGIEELEPPEGPFYGFETSGTFCSGRTIFSWGLEFDWISLTTIVLVPWTCFALIVIDGSAPYCIWFNVFDITCFPALSCLSFNTSSSFFAISAHLLNDSFMLFLAATPPSVWTYLWYGSHGLP